MPKEPQRILRIYGLKKPETETYKQDIMRTSQRFTSECFVAILGETGKPTRRVKNIPEKLKCEECDLDISAKICGKYHWGSQPSEEFPRYAEFRNPTEWVS